MSSALPVCCRGCVHHRTLAYAQEQVAWLGRAPSLAFIHIPVPEFMYAWLWGACNGSKEETVGCPSGAHTLTCWL